MRARLENFLQKTWYGGRKPGFVLLSLERLYRLLFAVNRKLNTRRSAQDLKGKPIIIVGNLNAGGAGKTPMVIRLCELAKAQGIRPGVVSRGYGRRSSGPIRVSPDLRPKDTGDEPFLIAARTGVPVQVDSDRENAVRTLFEEGVDLVIADDGLQRYRLPRNLEICMVDRDRGFGNGHLLPAGPLREPATRLESVDLVVEHLPPGARIMQEDACSMKLEPGRVTRLHGEETRELSELAAPGTEIHAIAGIAHPGRFFEMLTRAGLKFTEQAYPDHHRYRKSDFEAVGSGSLILMTEKDAVKCRSLPLHNAWYIPVQAVLSESLELELNRYFQKLNRSASSSGE